MNVVAECHAVIYVVDSGDRERVEESKAAFDRMIKNENVRGIPLLVAANKQDLADCMERDLSLRQQSPGATSKTHFRISR